MSVLIDLPSVLFSAISVEWLCRDELVKFDTACCNKSLRISYLNELKQFSPILSSSYSDGFPYELRYSISMYKWVYVRNIKLQAYSCDPKHYENGKLLYSLDCSKITSIICYIEFSMSDIVNSCPNLTILVTNHDDIPKIKPSVLSNLTRLDLTYTDTSKNYQKTIKTINAHCKNLHSISDGSDASCSVFKFMDVILRNNINLTAVDGKGDNNTLRQILSYPKIEDIVLFLDEDLDVSIFYDIFQRESEDFWAQISDLQQFNYKVKNNQKSLDIELNEDFDSPLKVIDLLSHTKELTSFTMNYYSNRDIVNAISQYCHSTLTTLQIHLFNVNSEAIKNLLVQCNHLTNIDVMGDFADSLDDIFETKYNNLLSITAKIYVDYDEHIRESSILKIIDNCPNLTELTVYGVSEMVLSADSVKASLKNHKNLKDFAIVYEYQGKSKILSYNGDVFETKIY